MRASTARPARRRSPRPPRRSSRRATRCSSARPPAAAEKLPPPIRREQGRNGLVSRREPPENPMRNRPPAAEYSEQTMTSHAPILLFGSYGELEVYASVTDAERAIDPWSLSDGQLTA